jgi:hypothetical protein
MKHKRSDNLTIVGRIIDTRSNGLLVENMASHHHWLQASEKEDRADRERAQRRREKLVSLVSGVVGAMNRMRAEPEEIRDLLLQFAVLEQLNITRKTDEALLAAIELEDPVDAFLDAMGGGKSHRSISVGEDNPND